MKTNILLSLLLFFYYNASAQLLEDFEDADLNSAPVWTGDLSAFTTSSGQLKSNYTTANSTFFISTGVFLDANFQFEYDCRLLLNTSSLNYTDVYLYADSPNLKTVRNGVFVRAGGSTDEVSLYKIQNGVESEIIDGKDAVLNNSDNRFKIKVIYQNDTFYLYRYHYANMEWIKEGVSYYLAPVGQFTTGFKIRQSTSAFFGKHFFDNVYSGPVLKDTTAPLIDSTRYDDQQILCLYFNETVDTTLLVDTSQWVFTKSSKHPNSIQFQNKGRIALVHCASVLPDNQWVDLRILNLSDFDANRQDTLISFFTLKKEMPKSGDILITELMIDPDPPVGLPNSEYIEIHNVSDKYLTLLNCRITDPTSFKVLPNRLLAPDSIMLLNLIPSLNNASDVITLIAPDSKIIDQVAYSDSWYKDTFRNKGGYSLERIDLTNTCLGADNWKASMSSEGGTPGAINSVNAILPKDTIPPQIIGFRPLMPNKIRIELNEVFDSVTLNSLVLNIDNNTIQYSVNYQIPSQRLIELQLPDYLTDTALYQFSISGFKDCPGNVSPKFSISAQMLSVPDKYDIIINEVLFNPRSGNHDFIELYNRSAKSFDLSELFLVDFKNARIQNIYPLNPGKLSVGPNTYLLLTEDTSQVCQSYSCPDKALKCQLKRMPSLPDAAGEFALINLQSQILDSLSYSAMWHFSLLSDLNGVSLERLNPNTLDHLQSNWHSAASVYGYATPGAKNSQIILPVKTDKFFNPNSRTLSPDGDGFQDVFVLNYSLPDSDYTATVSVYDLNGRLMTHILNHQSLGSKGDVVWDGLSASGSTLTPGIYIVTIDATSINQIKIREQYTVILCARK